MKKISLPEKVEYILNVLFENGYEANVVGGGVRDFLLGRPSSDYDVTTSARPEEIKAVFKGERIIETGIKHGTVTLNLDGENYEITTYRLDGDYLDNRHPQTVEFTRELRIDTARRDFTMNAICYNPRDGFSDFHGGIADIEGKLIRTVGDPEMRFSEDALRIMRAIRFSAVLGFEIDLKTRDAIFSLSDRLSNISRERIFEEWRKMLSGKYAYKALSAYGAVIKKAIPNISLNLPKESLFDKASAFLRAISLFDSRYDYETAMRSLHSDTRTLRLGGEVLDSLTEQSKTETEILLMLKKHGKELAELIIGEKILLGLSDENELELLRNVLASGKIYELSALKINGSDIARLGYRGEKIGELLDLALLKVIYGELPNEMEALLSFVNKTE